MFARLVTSVCSFHSQFDLRRYLSCWDPMPPYRYIKQVDCSGMTIVTTIYEGKESLAFIHDCGCYRCAFDFDGDAFYCASYQGRLLMLNTDITRVKKDVEVFLVLLSFLIYSVCIVVYYQNSKSL